MVGSALKRFGGVIVAVIALFAVNLLPAFAASSMKTGGLTSQPIGHFEFCQTNTAECRVKSIGVQPLMAGSKTLALVETVNAQVNAAILPQTDRDVYAKDEVWAYPRIAGDCEDYVLLKRRILMNKGISPSNLLITVVRKPDGEGHAVLTVRTKRGDYVLDNLNDQVMPWEATGYRYLKRQSSEHTGHWVTIEAPKDILVGSVSQ
ncbi:MAG: transglutaminase-like cysteine peptidase [Rhizobiaceae bacterium]